jgi:hypothetical protein
MSRKKTADPKRIALLDRLGKLRAECLPLSVMPRTVVPAIVWIRAILTSAFFGFTHMAGSWEGCVFE